jgi:hypothetical protein
LLVEGASPEVRTRKSDEQESLVRGANGCLQPDALVAPRPADSTAPAVCAGRGSEIKRRDEPSHIAEVHRGGRSSIETTPRGTPIPLSASTAAARLARVGQYA